MDAVRTYLLRLVICAFVVSLLSELVRAGRLRQLLRLAGACLLALVALQPLVQLDFSGLTDALYPYGLSQQNLVDEAARKNAALLEAMIREQTEAAIRQELALLACQAEFDLQLQMDQQVGAPVPWAIKLYGVATPAQKAALAAYLSQSLGILEERQTWISP